MAIFKYTVANKEGKKLSGTVEAPGEDIARKELNNLGFSIFSLVETHEQITTDNKLPHFVFEALDKNSKQVTGTIPSKDLPEAMERLETEYNLTLTAIWPEGAKEEEIKQAREAGHQKLQQKLQNQIEESKTKNLELKKEEAFIKNKIEVILGKVTELLQKFDQDIDADQKAEIHKKINKLLRIKNSTNFEYILLSAHELLEYIEKQEKSLKEKGYQEKQFELRVQTKNLLNELNRTAKPESLAEDIISKIENWEAKHSLENATGGGGTKLLAKILQKIKNYFKTPPEIQVIKEQIRVYNRQLWEFIKLYFKEPNKEYKDKVKKTLKTIWDARKKAKHSLGHVKKLLKERRQKTKNSIPEENLALSFIEELNALSGWLLAFYLIYYFISLYLRNKYFGIINIPEAFNLFDTKIFKYILIIVFLLHSATSLKINFFRQNLLANIVLPIFFIFGTILTLLNF